MAKNEMVAIYVDSLLKRITGNTDLKRDPDGDWPFRLENSLMFVRVSADEQGPTVRVWSVAAQSVPAGEKVFTLINELNQKVQFARVFWDDGAVFVATELVGSSLDIEELDTAVKRVMSVTEAWGPKIVEACGGSLVRPPEPAGAGAGQGAAAETTGQKPTSG